MEIKINEETRVARRFADIDADIAATEVMAPPQGRYEEFDDAGMTAVRVGIALALEPDARNSPA